MTGTYCQINSQSLRNYVLQRKITRAELASHMEVNTKTIQRWVNGHVTRVHIDAVKKLSTVLQCPLEDIIHPEKTLTVQTKNRALEELLSPEIFHQVHGSREWGSYLLALKEFERLPLPTQQQARLLCRLGYLQLQRSCYFSARRYLNRSLDRARAVQDFPLMIYSLSYISSCELALGNIDESVQALGLANSLAYQQNLFALQAEAQYRYAKLHILKGEFHEADIKLRQSISLELISSARTSTRGLALKYIQLARLALRSGHYEKARKFYYRAEVHSYKNHVRTTEAVACYGQALIALLQNEISLAHRLRRRARALAGGMSKIRKNKKFLHIEFIFALNEKNYSACMDILRLRYILSRRSKVALSQTVRMAFLLEKASAQACPVRRSWLLRYNRHTENPQLTFLKTDLPFQDGRLEDLLPYLLL